ncbi:hypothetical protein KEJ15_03875 [Candidatus Bathyarchaeota archaeon]|nr:hypothetical protein [Candidatus Bathyarchaeota archaeon]
MATLKKFRSILEIEEKDLKILIVYDTVSEIRNTEKIAVALSEVLKERGLDVDCLYVKNADPSSAKSYDGVLAGAPTMAFRATRDIMRFLDSLAKDTFAGKFAAAFDTQVQSIISGNAAKGIEKKLQKLGFRIAAPPLVAYVERRKKEYYLKE